MKREFITGLLPDIDKGVLDQIMAEHGRDIEGQKNTITTLTTERDGLQTQLGAATTTIKSYEGLDVEGIKTAAKDWEAKYNTETQTLKDQLAATAYGYSVKEATSGLRFTSESARKAFVADLTAKKLPVQEGKLLGMEDFVKAYQTGDPGAFVPEGDDKTPIASKGIGGDFTSAISPLRAAFGLQAETKKE